VASAGSSLAGLHLSFGFSGTAYDGKIGEKALLGGVSVIERQIR
jgi:hypothetical protein